jgi:ABC-type oligopeptide transport system ATPase subunit
MYTLNNCTVVGIVGSAGVGKSTVAQLLEYRYGFVTFNFADELKLTLHKWFDTPFDILFGPSEKKNAHFRAMMQHLGTDFARSYDPDVWVRLFMKRLNTYVTTGLDPLGLVEALTTQMHPPRISIGDVRFPNEAAAIAAIPGGHVIRITREQPNTAKDMPEEQHQHLSETSQSLIPIEHIEHTLYNNGSLDQLAATVFNILSRMEQQLNSITPEKYNG